MFIRILLALCYLTLSVPVIANNSIQLAIGQWSFEDVQANNLTFDINLTTKGLALIAHADSLKLADPIGKVSKVQLVCDELILRTEQFSCVSGKVTFRQAELGQQKLTFKISGQPEQEKYQIDITGLRIASAQFSAKLKLNKKYWRVNLTTPKVTLTELHKTVASYMDQEQLAGLADWEFAGDIKLSAELAGWKESITTLLAKISATSFQLTDRDSRYVTENMVMIMDVDAKKHKQTWQWKTKLNATKGQGFADPIFIDFDTTPTSLIAEGHWQDKGKLNINSATFKQNNVLELTGNFSGSLTAIDRLNVKVVDTNANALYEHWLQPFVVGTAIDNLKLEGGVALSYYQKLNDYHLNLTLEKLYLDDQLNRFSVDGLNGNIAWTNYNKPSNSDLSWEKASLYAIPIGKTRLQAEVNSSVLTLSKPWQIPLFDGALNIKQLTMKRPGEQNSKWTFAGELSPISMEQVSLALNWPELHGKLSGKIPKVSYSEKKLGIEGALKVKLFEGTTIIRDLQLDQPFGSLPQLYANINLQEMNLATLTEAFDFGEITGKLTGEINNLRLSNWRPVHFDAHFETPENDKSRHRISQQAVNNLSKVGGGVGGALQRSFLRFFEDFSYKRLGLSCKLRNEVCEMAGIGEAKQGYYIVKGGGLPPRINVVGYTRRVDWPDLIERLKAVSNSPGPVVQ